MLSGCLLAASFPPSPLNYLIYIAFVPLLVLFEKGIVPDQCLEDRIFLPFKRTAIVLWRLLGLQFVWRKEMRGRAIFAYKSHLISDYAQLFRYNYAAFFIWNACCCYWLMLTALGASSVAEGLVNAVAGVLAIALNPLLMAIPLQFLARLRRYTAPGWAALGLVPFWLAFEYFHHHWELSWPWLTLGNALSYHPAYIQYVEFTGVLGISAHILFINWLVYLAVRQLRDRLGRRLIFLGIAAAVFVTPWLLYPSLTDAARPILQSSGQLKVRMVQPDVDPYQKSDELPAEQRIGRYIELMSATPLDTGRIVMLPEKALLQPLEPRTMLKGRMLGPLWDVVDSFQVEILMGIEDIEDFRDTIEAPISARENYRLIDGKRQLVYSDHYNSAWIVNTSRSTQVYRKEKLMPMVERVPFLGGLRWLKFLQIDPAKGMLSYGRPDSLTLLQTLDSIPTNVLICYESAFGDPTRQKTAMGARWIAMITNDGWWRQSSGYIQHAGLSIIRAIENRRTLARCANNGRSMIIEATGETSQQSDWGVEAVIDADIALYDGQTFYVTHGDYIGFIACWISGGLIALTWVLRLIDRKKRPVSSTETSSESV